MKLSTPQHATVPHRHGGEGISSVIGVILLITIVILLSTAVASFALGFQGLLEEPAQASTLISESYDSDSDSFTVQVTVSAMPNAEKLEVQGPTQSTTLNEVGDTVKLTNLEEGDSIRVVGVTSSNSRTLIQTHKVGQETG